MRCKACAYPLWNLTARTCPECGSPFAPTQFEFKPGTVQFRCPHCALTYYGTGEGGHLVPPAFECGGCGKVIHEDDMLLVPTEGLEDEQTTVAVVPWAERREKGFFRSMWKTFRLSMFSPNAFGRMLDGAPSIGSAWSYAVCSTLILGALSLLPFFIFVSIVTATSLGGRAGGGAMATGMLMGWVILAVVIVVTTLAMCSLWSLAAHLVLRITGKTDGGLGRTFEAIHYCAGAQVLNAVPCIGLYMSSLTWIWWAITAIFVLKSAQKVSTLRATVSIFALPALMLAAVIPIVLFGFWSLSSLPFPARFPTRPGSLNPVRYNAAGSIATAMREYAMAGDGSGPKHVALLLAQGSISPDMLLAPGSSSTLPTTQASGAVLVVYDHGDSAFKSNTAALAVMVLGEGVVAYRVGDYVFCDRGIDYNKADPALWVVVSSFDPQQNNSQETAYTVGLADGTMTDIPDRGMFATALAAQNELRAKHGLKPLPDPSTITNPAPAK